MDPFLPDDAKVAAIRESLPSTGSGIRLDTSVAGPFPAETDRAVREADEWELRVGRGGGQDRAEDLAQRADEARSVVAAVLGASPERVLLAPGPVGALNALLDARQHERPERIVLVEEVAETLRAAVDRIAVGRGATVLPIGGDASAIPAGASLVVASHVDAATGTVRDVERIAAMAREHDAFLVLDAGWSAGAIPLDASATRADALLVDGHRWLLGPEGVTALWVAEPFDVDQVGALIDPLPRGMLMGLARSVGWLLMYVGLPWAFERAARLTGQLRTALAEIGDVDVLTPAAGLGTMVVFRICGWSAEEAAHELGRRCFAVVDVDMARDLLRAAVGAWVREEELDRFVRAVAELASHSPATLPRRPALTILGSSHGPSR